MTPVHRFNSDRGSFGVAMNLDSDTVHALEHPTDSAYMAELRRSQTAILGSLGGLFVLLTVLYCAEVLLGMT